MRAAVVESVPGKASIDTIDIDEPGLGEVLVRVEACGVCHSDVHSLQGHVVVFPVPFVLGHEPAGVVEAVRFMADVPRLVEHALAGRLDLDVMVSAERTLDELPAALAELDAGEVLGRTVIVF